MRGLAALAVITVTLAPAALAATHPAPVISEPVAGQAREGQPLVLHGHVRNAPRGAYVELQASAGAGWRTLARVPLRGGAFAITWHPRAGGLQRMIRFALAGPRGRLLLAGRAQQELVGQAPVLCVEPATPVLAPGEGAIIGGVYIDGGPAPGVHACSEGTGTVVEVLNSSGAVLASQTVSEKQSYVFQLPPGSYTLRTQANYCSGQALVKAGLLTHADTECAVP